jgi:DNA-binding Lrp family transcriptional regulator
MTLEGLDDLDRHILHELQRDARHTSSSDVASEMGVSASTVRKRLQRLESEGILTGFHASVDYEQAGYQLHILLFCTAPIPKRETLGERALEVRGVVEVREIATGEENLHVTVVAEDSDDLTRIARELAELGLTIGEEELIRNDAQVPFDGFASLEDERAGAETTGGQTGGKQRTSDDTPDGSIGESR